MFMVTDTHNARAVFLDDDPRSDPDFTRTGFPLLDGATLEEWADPETRWPSGAPRPPGAAVYVSRSDARVFRVQAEDNMPEGFERFTFRATYGILTAARSASRFKAWSDYTARYPVPPEVVA